MRNLVKLTAVLVFTLSFTFTAKAQEIKKTLEKVNFGRVEASHKTSFDASNPSATQDYIFLSWQNYEYESIIDIGSAFMYVSFGGDIERLVEQLEMVISYAHQGVTVYGKPAACKVITYDFSNDIYLVDNGYGEQTTTISINQSKKLVEWLKKFL